MNITRTITAATLLGIVGLGLAGCGSKPGDASFYSGIDHNTRCAELYGIRNLNNHMASAAGLGSDQAVTHSAYAEYALSRAMDIGCPSPQSLGISN